MKMIDQHKPKRLLFANRWLYYLQYTDPNGPSTSNANCYHGLNWDALKRQSKKDAEGYVQEYKKLMKSLVDRGFEVYVVNIHLEGD